MAASQAQNVQRGIIMVWFIQVVLLLIMVIARLIKKRIDPLEERDEGGVKYQEGDKQPEHKQSQERIDAGSDFDKAAVRREELSEDATCADKLFYSFRLFNDYYGPILILLPLNILTGTAKAFSLTLFFIISLTISLFNIAKIHRKLSEHKCVCAVFENLWLGLSFFFCVNQWGATPIAMPYIVI